MQKWGNSQGIRLPKAMLEIVGLEIGVEVDLELSNDSTGITIRAASPSRPVRGRYRIEDLVSRIPRDYKAEEVDWGDPQGKEAW